MDLPCFRRQSICLLVDDAEGDEGAAPVSQIRTRNTGSSHYFDIEGTRVLGNESVSVSVDHIHTTHATSEGCGDSLPLSAT